jgi:hypothetical protein
LISASLTFEECSEVKKNVGKGKVGEKEKVEVGVTVVDCLNERLGMTDSRSRLLGT